MNEQAQLKIANVMEMEQKHGSWKEKGPPHGHQALVCKDTRTLNSQTRGQSALTHAFLQGRLAKTNGKPAPDLLNEAVSSTASLHDQPV